MRFPKILLLATAVALVSLSCGPKEYSVKGNTVTVKLQAPVLRQAQEPAGELVEPAKQVRLQVLGEKIIRVSATPDKKFNDRKSLVVLPVKEKTPFTVTMEGGLVKVATSAVTATVDPATGKLAFTDAAGKTLLRSGEGGKMAFAPIEVEGKKAFSTQVVFDSPADEAFYGLGQQQTGEFDHKGLNEELYQYNTKISIPFVVSSKGYGLLFDAYSWSRWGNPNPFQLLGHVFKLYDKDGVEGALTGTYVTRRQTLVQREEALEYDNERLIGNLPKLPLQGAIVTYEGEIEAPVEGDYYFSQYYAGFQTTEIGGEETMSRRWRPAWNPNSFRYKVHFNAGERKPVKVTWEPDGGVSYFSLKVAVPQSAEDQARLSFWSEFEPELDFYFMAGNDYDEVISGYRTLTGKASLYPKWSFGFWQSRERYTTQEELVSTLAEFRKREIPVDNIVQDWHYWLEDQWGSHEFDAARYPDPEKMKDAGRRPRDARPLHDQRLAQVLHEHGPLQGAQGGGLRLHARRGHRPRGLAQSPAVVLRRLCRRRPQDVLAPDGRDPLFQVRQEDRRVVDGRFGTEPPRLPPLGLFQVAAHPDGPRSVHGIFHSLFPRECRRHLQRPARGQSRHARVSAHPQRFRRPPALFHGLLER